MKKVVFTRLGTLLLLVAVLMASSCASTGKARKCNGQKAIRTPMGPM